MRRVRIQEIQKNPIISPLDKPKGKYLSIDNSQDQMAALKQNEIINLLEKSISLNFDVEKL